MTGSEYRLRAKGLQRTYGLWLHPETRSQLPMGGGFRDIAIGAAFDEKRAGSIPHRNFRPTRPCACSSDSYLRDGTAHCLEMVTTTLDHLQRGRDPHQLAGGFARYSTDDDWHVPHFERCFMTTLSWPMPLLQAYQVTKNEKLLALRSKEFSIG